MKTFIEYLTEKEMEFYDNPKVVQKIPDSSDSAHGAKDFMYSNSNIQSFYSRGNGFKVNDQSEYYEIIKTIKDLTDKHLFLRSLTWKVDSINNKIIFKFIITNLESDEATNFFLHGIQQHLMLNIIKRMGNLYQIDSDFSKDKDQQILRLILTRTKEERPRLEIGQAHSPNVEIMNPKDSSISKI